MRFKKNDIYRIKIPDVKAEESEKWYDKIKISGDLRLRHDTQWREEKNGATEYARHRERFRFRIGMDSKINDNTKVGFGLASGDGEQNTTNQSADEHARGKGIFIDLAYADWKASDMLTIIGGKHKNPLFTTSLVWDPDVNPEGLSESFGFNAADRIKLYANLGQWFIEELDTKNSDGDPTLLVYQIGSDIKPVDKMKVQFALTYYDFLNLDQIDYDDLNDDETFIGYNHRHSQQLIFDKNKKLLNEFKCLEIGIKADLKDVLPVPVSLFGNYIQNLEADTSKLIAQGVNPGDSAPSKLSAYGNNDRDTGWQLGFSVHNRNTCDPPISSSARICDTCKSDSQTQFPHCL